MEFTEAIDKYREQEKLTRTEGRTGVENLCRLVRAIGYQDPLHFGQFAHNASIGDLIEFLKDNSGCIETIIDWIGEQPVPEWKQAINNELHLLAEGDGEDEDESASE